MMFSRSGIVVNGHAKQLFTEVPGLPPLALGTRTADESNPA